MRVMVILIDTVEGPMLKYSGADERVDTLCEQTHPSVPPPPPGPNPPCPPTSMLQRLLCVMLCTWTNSVAKLFYDQFLLSQVLLECT